MARVVSLLGLRAIFTTFPRELTLLKSLFRRVYVIYTRRLTGPLFNTCRPNEYLICLLTSNHLMAPPFMVSRILSSSLSSSIMHMLAINYMYYVGILTQLHHFRHDRFSQRVPKHFRQKVFILYYGGNVVFREVQWTESESWSQTGNRVQKFPV